MGLCVETHTGSSIADMKPYPRGGLILSDRGHPFFMTRTRSGLDRYPPPIGHRIPSIHDQLKQHLFEPLTINLNTGKVRIHRNGKINPVRQEAADRPFQVPQQGLQGKNLPNLTTTYVC